MSALANTIRMLSGRLALLRAERERYQALCAAAYQLAGAMNAPVRFIDALSDGANGEIEARQKAEDLLPLTAEEMGAFPARSAWCVAASPLDEEAHRSAQNDIMHARATYLAQLAECLGNHNFDRGMLEEFHGGPSYKSKEPE